MKISISRNQQFLFRSFKLISQDTHLETKILFVDQPDSTLSALLDDCHDFGGALFRCAVIVNHEVVLPLDVRGEVALVLSPLLVEITPVHEATVAQPLRQQVFVPEADEDELQFREVLLCHASLFSES